MSGYVYLFRAAGRHKIGASSRPDARFREVTAGEPDAAVVHLIPSERPFLIESCLKGAFADKQIRGEWFDLDATDVARIRAIGMADVLEDLPADMRPGEPISIDGKIMRQLAVITAATGQRAEAIISPILEPAVAKLYAEVVRTLGQEVEK